MAVTTTKTNKPLNPRGNDQSPKGYNRAELYTGKALDFDGVNDSISVPYSDTLGGVWTWVSIIEADALSGYQELFGGMYSVSNATIYLKENQLTIYTNQDNFNTAFNFETGKKYHVACSQSGDTISVYVNGQAAGSVSLTIPLNSTSGTYIIGKRPNQANEYFNGKMSGVKLFNTALTAAQVADLYNNPEKIVPTGVADSALKLWLPMQEGAGTTAYNGAPDALGSELITNGNFETNSDWSLGSGSTISGGSLNIVSAPYNANTKQTISLTSGKTYIVNINATATGSSTDNTFQLGFGDSAGNPSNLTQHEFTPGTSIKSLFITASATDATIVFRSRDAGTSNLSVHSVSAKEITGVGTISGATWTHGIGAPVAQTAVIDWNKFTLDLSNEVLIPQGLTAGRDLLGNLFENVRKQGALNLDGNSWAEVHDNESLDITGDFSLEGWIYFDADVSYRGSLVSKYKFTQSSRAYALERSGININVTVSSDGSATAALSSSNITTTGWMHCVATYDGSFLRLYINGAVDGYSAYTSGVYAHGYPVTLGVLDTASQATSIMKDQIAQPRIYDRALTAEEVERNYTAGKYIYTND